MKHNVLFYQGSGKIGNMVGYKLYGKQCFRAYQPVVANPKSTTQNFNRAKLAFMSKIASLFLGAARLGMTAQGKSEGHSGFAEFVQTNIGKITGGSIDALTLDPMQIVVAEGTVPNALFSSTPTSTNAAEVNVNIQAMNDGTTGASDDDDIYGVCYAPDANGVAVSAPIKRSSMSRSITVLVPASWSGIDVHCYGFAVNGDGKASHSQYAGHVECA